MNIATQQTRTRDFTCSVSKFTNSTGSIHVNSPDSVDKFVRGKIIYIVASKMTHTDIKRTLSTYSEHVKFTTIVFVSKRASS